MKKTINAMDDYLYERDWRVKENSNIPHCFGGLINHIAGTTMASYWLEHHYKGEIADAHINGDIHISDLGVFASYCNGIDLEYILMEGINGVAGQTSANPPKHFVSALNMAITMMTILQSEFAGAQAYSSFDLILSPYVKKDKLSYDQVYQYMQNFIWSLNYPMRLGAQSIFSNLTFDLVVSDAKSSIRPMIAGELMDFTYLDCQPEMDMINMAFVDIMVKGDSDGKGFAYPIPTYNITKKFNWDGKIADKIFNMTNKYGIPYFQNMIGSDLDENSVKAMCPVGGNEFILHKTERYSYPEYSRLKNLEPNKIYNVYSEGVYKQGIFTKYENKTIKKIKLVNGHELVTSTDHINLVADKDKNEYIMTTNEIIDNMGKKELYIPYSLKSYKGYGGDYDLGYLVGCCAGDGTVGEHYVTYSLSDRKLDALEKIKTIVRDKFGAECGITEHEDIKLITLRVLSKSIVGICADFVSGIKIEKHYNPKLFTMSEEFRRGVLDGHMDTDGQRGKHRISTSSKKMVRSLNMLASTLGTFTHIMEDNRDGRYGENTNYIVRFYTSERKSYGDMWFKTDDKVWVRINDVVYHKGENAYCFEILDDTPYFTLAGTGILTHNCRLSLNLHDLQKKANGIFGAGIRTGSVGVATVNLPRLGYLSKTKEEFFKRLGTTMDMAKDSLEIKRMVINKWLAKGLYPYTKRYVGSFNTFFSTIGFVGANEMCINFMGKGIYDKDAKLFVEDVLEFMNSRLIEYQETTGNLYNLEQSPAESMAGRLARKDKEIYPDIITAGTDNPYYTNSCHLPVGHTTDPFEVLEHQESLVNKINGGSVTHIYIGEAVENHKTIKNLVKKICENYSVPYFSITPNYSLCPVHGYLKGVHAECPECKSELDNMEKQLNRLLEETNDNITT